MTDREPNVVGVTDLSKLCDALRAGAHSDESLDDDRRQRMLTLADSIYKRERVTGGTWILDYVTDVAESGETYKSMHEVVAIEPDGRVSIL